MSTVYRRMDNLRMERRPQVVAYVRTPHPHRAPRAGWSEPAHVPRALVPFCHDTEGPARQPDALVDADEPQSFAVLPCLGDIESPPVVRDREFDAVVAATQPDLGPEGSGVRHDVVQRFLGDPVQAESRLRIDRREVALGAAGHRDRLCPAKFRRSGRRGQPSVRRV